MSTAGRKTPVLYSCDRSLAFLAQPFEVCRLVDRECVTVEHNARGEFRAAVLRVPLRVARAVLAPPKVVRSREGITVKKQTPVRKTWIQRVDMAGRGAGSFPEKTIHFKVANPVIERWGKAQRREVAA